MKNKIPGSVLIFFTGLFLTLNTYALTPEPAPEQSQAIALVGATVHVGDGKVVENALVILENGKIKQVKSQNTGSQKNAQNLSKHQVIDATGKHIYPGFILPNSEIGLIEVDALRATRDNNEMGEINPSIRSIIAHNTDSELIPTLRFNGILMAQVTPRGGMVSGRSSVVELEGWNWQDASYLVDDGLHINWPSQWGRKFNFATFSADRVKNKKFNEQLNKINTLFEQAKAYAETTVHKVSNLKLDAMKDLFNGKMTLYVHTDSAAEIVASIHLAQQYAIEKVVIVGGEEALAAKDILLKYKVPVILSTIHRLPATVDSPITEAYELPALLHKAGIKVGLGYDSNMSARNLGFLAGTAAAYGLDKETALSLITKNNADILGIGRSVGTVEEGKDATLFISEGDALDMRTNQITHAFIRGKQIDLFGMQQQLYQRFHKKYSK